MIINHWENAQASVTVGFGAKTTVFTSKRLFPLLALLGGLGLAPAAYARAPSSPSPTASATAAEVTQSERAPGHSLQAGVGAGNNDLPVAELGYLLHLRRVKLGVVGQLGVLRYASIGGTIAESGLRLRGRLPVWVKLAEVADGRLRADLLLAPGVRQLTGEGRSATAITFDSGLQATVLAGKRWTFATAMILPVAIDVAPAVTVARFPGLTLGAGAWVRVAPQWSVGVQGFVSAPEGYGGDSEKSALEASVGVRWRWGNPRRSDDAVPLLNASI